MTGPLAQWAGLFDGPTATDDGSLNFFYIIQTLPDWVSGIVIVLAGCLTSSAYDTFQSAQISTIENDVFLGRVNIWICRAVLVAINVPSVVLAVKNIDILQVFLIADLGACAILPPVFLGLIPKLNFLNGFDAIFGAAGGWFTIFIFGTIFYGNAYDGGQLLILPNGLYVDDYSVLGAFFAAPLGGLGFTFVGFALRAGATWVFCRFTGREYTVFHHREFRTTEFVLPEDRPAGFAGIHGTGNPHDGHKFADEAGSDKEIVDKDGSASANGSHEVAELEHVPTRS